MRSCPAMGAWSVTKNTMAVRSASHGSTKPGMIISRRRGLPLTENTRAWPAHRAIRRSLFRQRMSVQIRRCSVTAHTSGSAPRARHVITTPITDSSLLSVERAMSQNGGSPFPASRTIMHDSVLPVGMLMCRAQAVISRLPQILQSCASGGLPLSAALTVIRIRTGENFKEPVSLATRRWDGGRRSRNSTMRRQGFRCAGCMPASSVWHATQVAVQKPAAACSGLRNSRSARTATLTRTMVNSRHASLRRVANDVTWRPVGVKDR